MWRKNLEPLTLSEIHEYTCDKLLRLSDIHEARKKSQNPETRREKGTTNLQAAKKVVAAQHYLSTHTTFLHLIQELHLQNNSGLPTRRKWKASNDDSSSIHVCKVQAFAGLRREKDFHHQQDVK